MRRVVGLASILVVMLLTMVSAGRLALGAGAQDATPPMGGFEIAPGVTAELVPAAEDPPSLYRLHVAAGVIYEFSGNPSLAVAYVEAGMAVLHVDRPVTVFQAGAPNAEGETFSTGSEFTVTAGTYFVLPPFAAGVVRNRGDEPASFSVAGIVPEGMATPVP